VADHRHRAAPRSGVRAGGDQHRPQPGGGGYLAGPGERGPAHRPVQARGGGGDAPGASGGAAADGARQPARGAEAERRHGRAARLRPQGEAGAVQQGAERDRGGEEVIPTLAIAAASFFGCFISAPILKGIARALGMYAVVEEGRYRVYVLFGKVV